MASGILDSGEDFGQSESLTTRLHGLVSHDYLESIAIFKELIQNADDAGAKTIEFVLDWQNHIFPDLDPNLKQLAGPAMLVFNDALFDPEDFTGIQGLGEGGKGNSLRKTGRFGLGFSSVYNMTDYPSIISREYICLLDPHGFIVKSPGKRYSLPGSSISFPPKFPDSLFLRVYHSAGFCTNTDSFQGTIFRFPFRTAEQANSSRILSKTFTREKNVEPLLVKLLETGEELLLFLKSIQEIKVREIEADGSETVRLHIQTLNAPSVDEERKKILNKLTNMDQNSLLDLCKGQPNELPDISYRHKIQTVTSEKTSTSTWRVVSLLRVDNNSEMVRVMGELNSLKEKAVPWGGAAARIDSDNEFPFHGKQFCFLPLPGSTGLPVHINGYFDLNSSRSGATGNEASGNAKSRPAWNKLIVKHVIAYAYARLIVSLIDDLGEISPEKYYSFFPVQELTNLFEELPYNVFQLLRKQKIIRSAIARPAGLDSNGKQQHNRWVYPSTIKIVSSEWNNLLLEPLRREKIDLPEPALPEKLIEAFARSGVPLLEFKPSKLRAQLQTLEPIGVPVEEAPKACLRKKEWVLSLLRYCLSDKHRDLTGLPLAILEDATLQSFGYNPPGFIYIVESSKEEILKNQIFQNYPHWFLDADFACLAEISNACKGITMLTPIETARRLKDLVGIGDNMAVIWEPDEERIPNKTWLTQVYNYFSDVDSLPVAKLKQIPLVPSNDGLLYTGGKAETPLWCSSKVSCNTLEMLNYFEIPLVKAEGDLREAISKFLSSHPKDIIWELTVPDLVDTLDAKEILPEYQPEYFKELIDFLASDITWTKGEGKTDNTYKNRLRGLKIYITTEGYPTALDNTDEKVYIPGEYEPPKVASSIKLLYIGSPPHGQKWREFYSFLGVKVLDRSAMIQHLVGDYFSLNSTAQVETLEWILENLEKAEKEQSNRSNPIDFKEQLGETPLIRCQDGVLRAAARIYDPQQAEVIRQVIGSQAYFPDMTVYRNKEIWLNFFGRLRIQEHPHANDILVYVDIQIANAKNGVSKSIYEELRRVFLYLNKNWGKFKGKKVDSGETLAEELKKRAWLPVERNPGWLSRYPGFMIPGDRLYQVNEICFSIFGCKVASQKPLFKIENETHLSEEFQLELGFRDSKNQEQYLDRHDVVNHFKVLIELWGNKQSSINYKAFEKSIESIYQFFKKEFLSDYATKSDRIWLRDQLKGYKCLFHKDTKSFWNAEHTFRVSTPYFGTRRQTIIPEEEFISTFVELFDQPEKPEIKDYLAFLNELSDHSRGKALSAEDARCACEVLKRIAREIELTEETVSADKLLLLTDDNLLRSPESIFIPDAPWYLEAVKDRSRVKFLHLEVPHSLAIKARCRSFLENVDEKPLDDGIHPTNESKAQAKCQDWEVMLRSPEFIYGLERLIHNQKGDDPKFDMGWLIDSKVVPADEIQTKLVLDGQEIASGLQGRHCFDAATKTFYISCDEDTLMLSYLVESLNNRLNQLTAFKLDNTLPLSMIVNTNSGNVNSLLDRSNIKTLNRSDLTSAPFEEGEKEPEQVFPPDEGEINALEVSQPELATTQHGSAISTQALENANPSTVSAKSQDKSSLPSSSKPNANNRSGAESPTSEAGTGDEISDSTSDGWTKTPTVQGSSGKPRVRGSWDATSGSESFDSEDKDANDYQPFIPRSTGLSPSDESRSKPNLSSGKSHPNSQYRNGVRVQPGLKSELDKEPTTQSSRQTALQIDKAGMACVMEYERRHSRHPQDMNKISKENHTGYDIKSTDPRSGAVRYIEVKSLRGVWDRRGVCMTRPQFKMGKKHKDKFWLYVVELAETDKAKVTIIKDPVGWVGEFYYDESWRQLAEDEGD